MPCVLWALVVTAFLGCTDGEKVPCETRGGVTSVCYVSEGVSVFRWFAILELEFDGDVVIEQGVRLETGNLDLSIELTGTLTIMEGAALLSGNRLDIEAKAVEVRDEVELAAYDSIKIATMKEREEEACERVSIVGDGVRIHAGSMSIKCAGGLVEITGVDSRVELGVAGGTTEFQHLRSRSGLTCVCNNANIGQGVVLASPRVNIEASTDLILSAADHTKVTEVRGMELNLKAGEWLHMGAAESEWRVTSLRVAASFVTVQTGHVIKLIDHRTSSPRMSRGRFYNTKEVKNADICPRIVQRAKWGSLDELLAHTSKEVELRFDAIIVSGISFSLLPNSRVVAASLLMCSGDTGTLGKGVMLSAACRGHGPGQGHFYGETRQSCQSAAGAANFGHGGQGAKFTTKVLEACALSSPNRRSYDRIRLPTSTASGGGCGVPESLCEQLRDDSQHPSAGGGLIWLSMRRLNTQKQAKIIADGCAGKIMTHDEIEYISGGGSGGQIIMFVETVHSNGSRLLLSSVGGAASCIRSVAASFVSGGGAGGFVGISWKDKPGSGKNLDVSVDGGTITDAECDRLVPQDKKQREKVNGDIGKAVSLKRCPSGYVGPFCRPCVVGTWGKTSQCQPCKNKPKWRAVYTKEAHDNKDCPYRCIDGVEPEDTNPQCNCKNGHVGEECAPCPVGTYAKQETCDKCSNKPHGNRSKYTTAGWHTSTCPFTCNMENYGPNCECPAGYGGPSCTACPVGTWSEFNSEVCETCRNKPSQWSEYTDLAAQTEHCAYRCVDAVPDVSENPLCACPAGFAGNACAECPIGKWSTTNSLTCRDCHNKPDSFSEYNSPGWPNATCSYRCTSDAFSLADPQCRGVVQYIADILLRTNSTLGVLGFVSFFLLGIIVVCLSRSSALRARRRDRRFTFVHDKLPFHLVRVHLWGHNRFDSEWTIGRSVPPAIEHIILVQAWDKFVSELNRETKVKRFEKMSERILKFVHPPLAPFFLLWRRRRRGYAMRELVRAYSEGKSNKDSIWRILPGVPERRSLQMIFTCDASAIVGYIDFFDNSQEQCNWICPDLQRETRVLVAHGLGSYLEPFALDVGDPLVEQLAQGSFDPMWVYDMVYTFNRLSRLVPAWELDVATELRPALQKLEAGVADRARRYGNGLDGVAIVRLIPHHCAEDRPAEVVVLQASFTDLVHTRITPGHMSPNTTGKIGDGLEAASRRFRLCLMFADRRGTELASTQPTTMVQGNPSQVAPPRPSRGNRLKKAFSRATSSIMSPASPSTLGELEVTPLTVPLAHDVADELFERIPERRCGVHRSYKWLPDRSTLLEALYRCGSQDHTHHQLCVRAFAYLSSLFLLLLDTILTAAQVSSFSSWWYVLVWLSVPPLVPILAIVSGFMFLFWEHWRLGRFHAFLVAWSGTNLVVASVLLAIHHSAEHFFTWCPLLVLCKLVLFACVTVRVVDIEERRYLTKSFTKPPEAASFVPGDAVGWSACAHACNRLKLRWRAWRLGRHESDDAVGGGIEVADMRRHRLSRSHSDMSDCARPEVAQASPF